MSGVRTIFYDHHITTHHFRFRPSSSAATLTAADDSVISEPSVSKTSLDVVTLGEEVNSPCATSSDVWPSLGLGVNQPPGKNFDDEDDDEDEDPCRL